MAGKKGSGRPPFPWPKDEMLKLYADGLSCSDLETELRKPHWQEYWKRTLGREYYPSHKIIHKRLRKFGCKMRKAAALLHQNHFWKGGRHVDARGYVSLKMPGHPNTNGHGYVQEHRLVMEKKLGRYLKRSEVVHHKDNNPSNNHPDNLELFHRNADHLAATLKGQVPKWTEDGRRRILAALRNPSAETKRLMSEARRNWWKRKKERDAEASKQIAGHLKAELHKALQNLSRKDGTQPR